MVLKTVMNPQSSLDWDRVVFLKQDFCVPNCSGTSQSQETILGHLIWHQPITGDHTRSPEYTGGDPYLNLRLVSRETKHLKSISPKLGHDLLSPRVSGLQS